jgi:hypothetical protein
MPYHVIVNLLVIVDDQCHAQMNMIDQMACGYETLYPAAAKILHQAEGSH